MSTAHERSRFGWSLPPGVSQNMIDELAGPDPDCIELRDVSCPICEYEGKAPVSVWLRTEKDEDGAYQVDDGTFYTCPKCGAEVAR